MDQCSIRIISQDLSLEKKKGREKPDLLGKPFFGFYSKYRLIKYWGTNVWKNF